MHQHYRTKGIVLSKRDSGEADQIFILYTQDFGKIEVVGRAIRKITSKLRAGIDVFYFIELEFIQGKKQKTLTDAIITDKFSETRKNPGALSLIIKISEIMCRLTIKEQSDENVWNLLFGVFQKIENCLKIENCKLKIIYYHFAWNLLAILGYSPELYTCPVCAKKLLPEIFFLSPEHGGVICGKCCDFPAQEITVGAVKLIRFFIKEPIEKVERLNILEKDLQNLNQAFTAYFDFLVEKG
ncbi:MAG: DNA repair protein RecO [bacterium]